MKSGLQKTLLIIIGFLLIILTGTLGNYYLGGKNNEIVVDDGMKDDNKYIREAKVSKKLDYKDIMNCTNTETNKGCVLKNGDDELVIYNEDAYSASVYETLTVKVMLNDKKLDVFNEPLNYNDIYRLLLTDEGVYILKNSNINCNMKFYAFDLNGNKIDYDLENYNICNADIIDNKVKLDIEHLNIFSYNNNYVCSDKDNLYIANNGDIEVKKSLIATIVNNRINFNTISSSKYSEYCNGGR